MKPPSDHPAIRSVRRLTGPADAPLPNWARGIPVAKAVPSAPFLRLGKLPPAEGHRSPLLRRVNSYRRAGVLVGLLAFLRRRDACRSCPRARTAPTHPGLYGCTACTKCLGSPERILQAPTTCPLQRWPAAASAAD